MKIHGIDYNVIDVYDQSITVPDSWVFNDNKTGKGHGEAKLYMGSKDNMRHFYTGDANKAGFVVECFVLKRDLLKLLNTIHHEYLHPSIPYRGIGENNNMRLLWEKRKKKIELMPDLLTFTIKDQDQIKGQRGYVNYRGKKRLKEGYDIIREIALPFVSYISVMKVQHPQSKKIFFYWSPFADFKQMASLQYAAQNYGKNKSKSTNESKKRKKQLKYREELFAEYKSCPFTHIDEFRLLVASHIKPNAVCNQKEEADPNNGIMLSPLFDKLFDKGFISFKDNGDIMISDWLSPQNKSRICFDYDKNDLRLNDERKKYLIYHRDNVFK